MGHMIKPRSTIMRHTTPGTTAPLHPGSVGCYRTALEKRRPVAFSVGKTRWDIACQADNIDQPSPLFRLPRLFLLPPFFLFDQPSPLFRLLPLFFPDCQACCFSSLRVCSSLLLAFL